MSAGTRPSIAPAVGLAGLAAVMVAKRMVWMHTEGDYRGSDITLDDYQKQTQYDLHALWTRGYSTSLLSALLAATALVVVLALLRPRWRPLAVVAASAAAALTGYVAHRLPLDAGLVELPSAHRLFGTGPGAWVAVGGFLLLAVAAALAPADSWLSARRQRQVGAVTLVSLAAWLAVDGIEYSSWYDSRGRDWPYPMYLRDLVMYVSDPRETHPASDLHAIAWTSVSVAGVLALVAVLVPALRRVAAVAGVLGAAAVLGVLTYEWHSGSSPTQPASHNPFFKAQHGLWFCVAACLVAGAAGLIAPTREPRGPR